MNYEALFEQDNQDLYSLFKPFVPLLPDFRPIETVKQMKGIINDTGDIVPESQNAPHCFLKETQLARPLR